MAHRGELHGDMRAFIVDNLLSAGGLRNLVSKARCSLPKHVASLKSSALPMWWSASAVTVRICTWLHGLVSMHNTRLPCLHACQTSAAPSNSRPCRWRGSCACCRRTGSFSTGRRTWRRSCWSERFFFSSEVMNLHEKSTFSKLALRRQEVRLRSPRPRPRPPRPRP